MIIYKNQIDTFQMVDFSISHTQLLLRSMKTKNRDYNIDIIMKGVQMLVCPTSINGLEITVLINHRKIEILESQFLVNSDNDDYIFSLKDNQGKEFFIQASGLGIYHNELEILATSIGRYDWENRGELQKWYAG